MVVMITNTIVPYCYDIAHVLGLPKFFPHRFRYRTRWIKLSQDVKSLKSQDALLVLRNFDSGDFIPIRYVQIEDVLPVGDISYIEFRVENYFVPTGRDSVSREIKAWLRESGFPNWGGRSLDCLVFELGKMATVDHHKGKTVTEHEDWSQILKAIGQLACYKDFGFLRILNVRDSKGIAAFAVKDETGKYCFALKPEQLYFVEVIQHVPWEIEKTESIDAPYDVELKAETDEVTVLRKIQRVVGKYDLLRFIFKTPSTYAQKHSFLEVENKQGGEAGKYGLPALFLPIIVRPPRWMRALLWLRILIGVIAVITLLASEPFARTLTIGPDWVRALALLVLVLASGKWDDFIAGLVKDTKEAKLK